jgi:hypothetical protein
VEHHERGTARHPRRKAPAPAHPVD